MHYDLGKYVFANRIIAEWNNLPDTVISANQLTYINNDSTSIQMI